MDKCRQTNKLNKRYLQPALFPQFLFFFCCLIIPREAYTTESRPTTLDELISKSHIIAVVRIESDSWQRQQQAIKSEVNPLLNYDAEILQMIKGPKVKNLSFSSTSILRWGHEFLVFLVKKNNSHLVVALNGYAAIEVGYITLKETDTKLTKVVTVSPSHIKLPSSIRYKPTKSPLGDVDAVLDDIINESKKSKPDDLSYIETNKYNIEHNMPGLVNNTLNKVNDDKRKKLHISLQNYSKSILEWETEHNRIRIDNIGNSQSPNFRYASWSINKSTKEEPDIILYNGKIAFNGNGGNHYYDFVHNKYLYRCHVLIISKMDGPEGILEIHKNNKLIYSEPVVKIINN